MCVDPDSLLKFWDVHSSLFLCCTLNTDQSFAVYHLSFMLLFFNYE